MIKHNVIYSVLSRHSKDSKPQTRVTAWLQLKSFIQQAKDSTSSRHEGGPDQRRGLSPSWLYSCIYSFASSLLSLLYAGGLAKKGVCLFHLTSSLAPVHGYSFVPFSRAFPFLCLLATTIFDPFFLF